MKPFRNVLKKLRESHFIKRLGKPTKDDMIAGMTNGIASIPDGMASGVIAGINPAYGLYTLMINTPIAALTLSTQLMVVNTTSAMILVASDGLGTLSGDDRVQAMFGIALVAGIFQLILGVLGLGTLTKFISNAVMTGLLTGVALLIILGQLWDFFGYSGEGKGKLQQSVDLLGNLRDIDIHTTIIGVLAIVIMIGASRTPLAKFNLILALAIATIMAAFIGGDSVALVSSMGDIPAGLPSFSIPGIRDAATMVIAGIAVGLVGLLQAAGVAQRYPNPNDREPDDSQDFMAQGLGNVAGSFFQAMPAGGSLSSTALGVSAGAKTRWASFSMAVVVLIVVLVFSRVLAAIPIAALAALLIYSATLSIKIPLIREVLSANWHSASAMMLTLTAALIIPIQQAIILGVIVAATLFVYRASSDIRVIRLRHLANASYGEEPVPAELDSFQTYILDVYGSLFYAGARTLIKLLPAVGTSTHSVVILRLRGTGEIGSTLLNVLNKYARELQDTDGRLILAGIDPELKERMIKSGQASVIGADNIFERDNIRHHSIELAEVYAQESVTN